MVRRINEVRHALDQGFAPRTRQQLGSRGIPGLAIAADHEGIAPHVDERAEGREEIRLFHIARGADRLRTGLGLGKWETLGTGLRRAEGAVALTVGLVNGDILVIKRALKCLNDLSVEIHS